MFRIIISFISVIFFTSKSLIGADYDIFGIGIYDIKFDGGATDQATDFRYERRFDKTLFDIGPEEDNFFYLKPFAGIEITSDSASYFLAGVYLEDNLGELFIGEESNIIFTPSFGVGAYDNGDGKKLGNTIEFRTTIELSYQLKNYNRIGISFGHISNANIGDKNPGVEIINLNYQIPFN